MSLGIVISDFTGAFTSLIHAYAVPGQEMRFDDISGGDLYHGRALDGSSTAASIWEVVRFYRDASNPPLILRARYVSGISWDNRASGGNWP